MILPTERAVFLAMLAAPLALALGIFAPQGWLIGVAFALAVPLLVLLDGLTTPAIKSGQLSIRVPEFIEVGDRIDVAVPASDLDYRAEVSAPLSPATDTDASPLSFVASRRGTAEITKIWARARGKLGLAYRQSSKSVGQRIGVLPSLRPVRENGVRQFLRSQHHGARLRPESGDGSEFNSLTDFQPGMERRAIDWKSSARNMSLLAREFKSERSNSLVFAIDCGRSMSDPIDGPPRVDRAVSAALLSAFVALKAGDMVRIFGFSARPTVDSGSIEGSGGFAQLQKTATEIDYSGHESNFTLSLITLDQRLSRRSLIVLFTEFTDTTSAELLLASAGRLRKRHRLMVVLLRDLEMEQLLSARPESADDVVRANVAHMLIRERRIVIERLRRMGVEVLEAHHDDLALKLVDHYIRDRERP